jgi:hypothetical protein
MRLLNPTHIYKENKLREKFFVTGDRVSPTEPILLVTGFIEKVQLYDPVQWLQFCMAVVLLRSICSGMLMRVT